MTASYSFTVKEPRHDRLDPQRYPAAAVCVDLDAVRIGCLLSLWEGARSDWRAGPTLGVAPIRIAGRPRGRDRGDVRVAGVIARCRPDLASREGPLDDCNCYWRCGRRKFCVDRPWVDRHRFGASPASWR